jgi:hydrogenase-4 component F
MDNPMTLLYLIFAFSLAIGIFINRYKSLNYLLLVLFLLLQWGFTLHACIHLHHTEGEYFTFDSLGLLLLLTLSVIAVPAAIHSGIYIETHRETAQSRAIYFSALISLITAIGAGYLANHIAVFWIFIEITTLSASALIYHPRNKLAREGTWKYVFICAISISFVFIGILFLSLSLQHAGSDDLSYKNLLANHDKLNPFWLQLAFLFAFTGYTAKLGLVPMFTAGIDAKDKAPAPAGALLASVLMNLGFVGGFRFFIIVANTPLHHWARMVVGATAFLSLFVATVYMVRVNNIKRMLAYSGLEHMGLVMLGVAAGGIGYYAAILHIILHALVKSSLFFQYTQLYRIFQTKNVYAVGNYFRYNCVGALALLLGFMSVVAIPPSGLFISEFLLFRSLWEMHQHVILVAVFLLLTTILWAFGKNILKILFIPAYGFDDRHVPRISPWESSTQFLLLALAAYLGIAPPEILVRLIQDSITLLPV